MKKVRTEWSNKEPKEESFKESGMVSVLFPGIIRGKIFVLLPPQAKNNTVLKWPKFSFSLKVMKWNWRKVSKMLVWDLPLHWYQFYQFHECKTKQKNPIIFIFIIIGEQTRWKNPERFSENSKEKTGWFVCVKAG